MTFDNLIKAQEERLARLKDIEDEQDMNFMRALSLWEAAENLKPAPIALSPLHRDFRVANIAAAFSPIRHYQNIRNIFRRQALKEQAMEALRQCEPMQGDRLSLEIDSAHQENKRELQELRRSFAAARDKVSALDYIEMDIFDNKLQQEIKRRTEALMRRRFDAMYPHTEDPQP